MPTLVHAGNTTGERGEREALLAFLEAQRGALRRAVLGLTDEQAASKPSASELSLSGLIKHALGCEDNWVQTTLMGRPPARKRDESNWHEDFQLVGDETVAGVLEGYAAVARQTEETILGLPDLEASVPLPEAPWFPAGMRVNARWVLLHLIEEAARHAGHADIIRESLDGKTSYVLIAEETGKAF